MEKISLFTVPIVRLIRPRAFLALLTTKSTTCIKSPREVMRDCDAEVFYRTHCDRKIKKENKTKMVNYIYPIFWFATQTFNGGYERHWGRGRILLRLSTSSIYQSLTCLRGFLVIFLYLIWFSLCSSLVWDLGDNGALKNLQI